MRVHAPVLHRAPQRGVIMVIALITLTLLLIGAAASMRSMSVSLSSVGDFGFKRDMANQAERGIRAATDALTTGVLSAPAARQNDNTAANYSATMLNSSPEGIPLALLDLNNVANVGGAGSAANAIVAPGVRVDYLIDRVCFNTGVHTPSSCQLLGTLTNAGSNARVPRQAPQPTYRITVRVAGPHNAYSFFQSTFTTLN